MLQLPEDNVIDTSTLNVLLSEVGSYSIDDYPIQSQAEPSYYPIFVIFAYLVIIDFVLCSNTNFSLKLYSSYFMSMFLVTFSFFKVLDIKGFADSYAKYDLLASRIRLYGLSYPIIEFLLGVLYIRYSNNFYLNLVTLVIFTISLLGVVNSRLKGEDINCACVGTFLNVPLGMIAIIENSLMVLMSLMLLFVW